MTFGEKVRAERKRLHLSQTELAKKIGVTQRAVTSYETNRTRPRGLSAYQRLADALGVNINYLLTEDEAFVASAGEEFGYRGRKGAEKLVQNLTALFAGGET
ncbi:MAG: helix-turn-helix transcriptional regulator [Oscillibacter sp.]|nr:helix-turn-helix transcriptional regulator [Oscillibacter sp.]